MSIGVPWAQVFWRIPQLPLMSVVGMQQRLLTPLVVQVSAGALISPALQALLQAAVGVVHIRSLTVMFASSLALVFPSLTVSRTA